MTLTRITTIANQMMTVTVNVLCSTMNVIIWYLWTQGTCMNSKKYRLLMFLIVVTSHMLCSIQLQKKTFSSKGVWFIPQLLYLVCIGSHFKLSHWVPWPRKCMFRHQNHVSSMITSWDIAGFQKKIVTILKIQDGCHRVLGKNVNIVFQIQ